MLINQVSRPTPSIKARIDNRSYDPLEWNDWLAIEMALDDYDPSETLSNAVQGIIETEGFLRLFAAAQFMTGMRRVEMHNFIFAVPDPTREYAEEERLLVFKDATQANLRKLLIRVELAAKLLEIPEMAHAARRCRDLTGLPCALHIQSAKTANQTSAMTWDARCMFIETEVIGHMTLLAWASQTRHLHFSPTQWDSIQSGMIRILAEIVATDETITRKAVNLHTLRHSFTDRAGSL